MRMKKNLFVILAAFLALTAAACSSPEGDTSATTEATQAVQTEQPTQQGALIEPSQLISQAEAEDILGVAVGEPEQREQAAVGQKLCVYEAGDKMLQVALTQAAMVPEGGISPEDQYRAIVDAFEDAEKADGIGDEAYFATPGLHILKDGYYISIAMGNSDDETTRNMLLEAGITAVNNLEKILSGA